MFQLTPRQIEANKLLGGPATHIMLFGGSRSGKTFLIIRAVVIRSLKAPGSRHGILRFRFNACRASIVNDTFPMVMRRCFPSIRYDLDHTLWLARMPNGSEIWFSGLDDKERTEKMLGLEFSTLFLNECSQISYGSRQIALTRLAQNVEQRVCYLPAGGGDHPRVPTQVPTLPTLVGDRIETWPLRLRMFYDQNPTSRAHWTYKLFEQGIEPDSQNPVANRQDYVSGQMNPGDNLQNLPAGYMDALQALGTRHRKRFLEGEYRDATPGALFSDADLDKWRVIDGQLPDMQRIVIAVDPSGASGTAADSDQADAIGIVVMGLGTDGIGYVIEDLTLRAGPATWGRVVATAFERHGADLVVGEANYGGAMVEHVIRTARPRTPYRAVTATRGKVVRAEPISALVETGRVRMVGVFRQLEEELAGFTTTGYVGESSPNRADAFVWAATSLFEGMVSGRKVRKVADRPAYAPAPHAGGWLGA